MLFKVLCFISLCQSATILPIMCWFQSMRIIDHDFCYLLNEFTHHGNYIYLHCLCIVPFLFYCIKFYILVFYAMR